MEELWMKVVNLVERSRIRVPLYIITIIFGITFFVLPNFLAVTSFVFLLGFLIVFESIHPNGYDVIFFKPLTPKFLPPHVQTTIFILIKIIFITTGLFFMFMGFSIMISTAFR